MPIDYNKYPPEFRQIAAALKKAVGYKCETCGKQCRKPGEPFDTHKRTLTVMHLDHNPQNMAPNNLVAGCAPCHCRYDARSKAEFKTTGKKTPMIQQDMEALEDMIWAEFDKMQEKQRKQFNRRMNQARRLRNKRLREATITHTLTLGPSPTSGEGSYKTNNL